MVNLVSELSPMPFIVFFAMGVTCHCYHARLTYLYHLLA